MGIACACLLAVLVTGQVTAQVPLACNGDFYLALGAGSSATRIYVLEVDEAGNAVFNPLSDHNTGQSLNGMGYRVTDNLLYAVKSPPLELFYIDATGIAKSLGLPAGSGVELAQYDFYTGAVTPDGKYLIVFGTKYDVNKIVVRIDLTKDTHPITVDNLTGPEVNCADIAFDPNTGTVYGFDAIKNRLVRINLAYNEVSAPFPAYPGAAVIGSLFFDAYGNLWGYGQKTGENSQRTLYRFDTETGAVTEVTTGPEAARSDGCSCPFTIKLREWTTTPNAAPCTRIPVFIEIVNASEVVSSGLRLTHDFPETTRIVSIDNPLDGMLTQGGPGFNHFTLEDLDIPPGAWQIRLEIELLPDAVGAYSLQSELDLLPKSLGGRTVSDNPFTIQSDDPAIINVLPLQVEFSQSSSALCPGEEIVLDPGIPGVTYQWSTGSAAPFITVSEAGEYTVTVTSGCDEAVGAIDVESIELAVELGPDLTLQLGDSLVLNPVILPSGETPGYHWSSSKGKGSTSCTGCKIIRDRPFEDVTYFLDVVNDLGCHALDSIHIRVDKTRLVYMPNAFSPNDDGINDRFFIGSQSPEEVVRFLVFDRWGALVYQRAGGVTGDPSIGWTGQINGRPAAEGVYVYLAELRFLDGAVERFSGSVVLVR